MPNPVNDAPALFQEIRRIVASPPQHLTPWKGDILLRIVNEAGFGGDDPGLTFYRFASRLGWLLDEPDDGRAIVLRRLLHQHLAGEPRVLADSANRDHLIHVTQVFLLGWVVLHRCRLFYDPPEKWRPYSWERAEIFEKLNESWLFAGMLHDTGYPVQTEWESVRHQAMLAAGFGTAYRVPDSGIVSRDKIKLFWRQMNEPRLVWTGLPRDLLEDDDIRQALDNILDHSDHGLHSAYELNKLNAEWCGSEPSLQEAISAIASHNHQYCVDIGKPHDAAVNRFFRLSFEREPLAALLHLCDELQEWSRERNDDALAREAGFRPRGHSAVHLTGISFPDPDELVLEVHRHRILEAWEWSPSHERRARLEQDINLAQASHRFAHLFPSNLPGEDPRFSLRLRVHESVGMSACRCEFRVNWPIGGALIAELDNAWRQETEERTPFAFQPVRIRQDGVEVIRAEPERTWVDQAKSPLRLILRKAGGRGKSTLMQQVAHFPPPGCSVYYVEQLPDRPVDLRSDLENLIRSSGSARLLILLDHLDRLVDDESLAFWLDQLSSLQGLDIDLILACRPDEFDRFFRASLGKEYQFKDQEWIPNNRGITRDLIDGEWSSGRELEDLLTGARLLSLRDRLASFAFHMGMNRNVARVPDEDWFEGGRLGPGGRSLLVRGKGGNIRFVHDCVQDLFSAGYLIGWLVEGKDLDRIGSALRTVPPDSFRLMMELLTRQNDGLFGTGEERANARKSLAEALSVSPTVQHWLAETGRLKGAIATLKQWAGATGDDTWARAVAGKLYGLTEYGSVRMADLRKKESRTEQLMRLRSAIDQWSQAVYHAEQAFRQKPMPEKRFQWLLFFLADHLLLALTRLYSVPDLRDESRRLAFEAQRRMSHDEPVAPFHPGRVAKLLVDFASAQDQEAIDQVLCSLFQKGCEVRQSGSNESGHFLDVRLAHLAGHIGQLYMDHAFIAGEGKKIDDIPTNIQRLEQSERWYEISISLMEHVLSKMDRVTLPGRPLPDETFASAAAGAGDLAHQYRGAFEARLLRLRNTADQPNLLWELAYSYRRMREAWRRAENLLEPNERLGQLYNVSLIHLALGRVIEFALSLSEQQMGKDAGASASKLTNYMQDTLNNLFKRASLIAVGSTRYSPSKMTAENILEQYRSALADPVTLIMAPRFWRKTGKDG